ncbi:MAG: hypothetical protein AAF371_15515 [Pseudomonadota bacterium]
MRRLIALAAMLALAFATPPALAEDPAPGARPAPAGEGAPDEAGEATPDTGTAPGTALGIDPGVSAETRPGGEEAEAMTLDTIGTVVRRLDAEAQGSPDGRMLQFTIRETVLLFVSDPGHNRMRLMTPIRAAEGLTQEELLRIAQANFDSALDARYAVAQGTLWSVFIHPLKELGETQFIAAIGQVVNAATSYGTSYSSGLLSFGGGDSNALRQRELIDELLKQGQPI